MRRSMMSEQVSVAQVPGVTNCVQQRTAALFSVRCRNFLITHLSFSFLFPFCSCFRFVQRLLSVVGVHSLVSSVWGYMDTTIRWVCSDLQQRPVYLWSDPHCNQHCPTCWPVSHTLNLKFSLLIDVWASLFRMVNVQSLPFEGCFLIQLQRGDVALC